MVLNFSRLLVSSLVFALAVLAATALAAVGVVVVPTVEDAHAQGGPALPADGGSAVWWAIVFVVSLLVSTVIIYVASKLFGQEEGIGRAFVAAIVGTVVYSAAYFLLGTGWLAAIVGGIVWLLALKWLYDIGWLKALGIAIVVWIAATVVGFLLPTAPGPL